MISIDETVAKWAGWVTSALIGAGVAVRWWYSVRKIQRDSAVDGVQSETLAWMFKTMRDELDAVRKDNALLRRENAQQAARIAHLEQAMLGRSTA